MSACLIGVKTLTRIVKILVFQRSTHLTNEASSKASHANVILSAESTLSSEITQKLLRAKKANLLQVAEINLGTQKRLLGIANTALTIIVTNSLLLPIVTGVIANVITSRRKTSINLPDNTITIEVKSGNRFFKIVADGSPASIKKLNKIARSRDISKWLD